MQNVTDRGNTTTVPITVGGITASGLIYPDTDGIGGQVLTTDGAGNLTFSSTSSLPTLPTGKIYVGDNGDAITSSFIHVSESNNSLIVGENNFVDHSGLPIISNTAIIGGEDNLIVGATNSDSFIGGGNNNIINSSNSSFIGGGQDNCIYISNFSTILGGIQNTSSNGGSNSILGGTNNTLITNYGFIGNGYNNHIQGATNAMNAIVSGRNNTITSSFGESYDVNFIGGGRDNTISGSRSSILGGENNRIDHIDSFIIGSNLTSSADCTTFMNNLVVEGTGSFGTLHTIYETSSIIYSSGSTKFGDTLDDTHQFTGSVYMSGSLAVTGSLNVSGSLVVDGPISSTVFETSYSSDTEAAAAGVPVYGLYRNGNFLFVRLS